MVLRVCPVRRCHRSWQPGSMHDDLTGTVSAHPPRQLLHEARHVGPPSLLSLLSQRLLLEAPGRLSCLQRSSPLLDCQAALLHPVEAASLDVVACTAC